MTEFKTAKQLKIEQWEFDNLIKVMEFLDKEEITTVENKLSVNEDDKMLHLNPLKFNMATTCNAHECGTALCIGGFVVALHIGVKLGPKIRLSQTKIDQIDDYVCNDVRISYPLRNLYYPPNTISDDWDKKTPKEGAKAIRHFLKTGKVPNTW